MKIKDLYFLIYSQVSLGKMSNVIYIKTKLDTKLSTNDNETA